jgi:hypothetical protein
MSEIRATTISDAAGTGPITLTKQSAAKAWVNFSGQATISIRNSLNVSGLVDNGAGDYTVNFTNTFSGNYFADCSATVYNIAYPRNCGITSLGSMQVSSIRFINGYSNPLGTGVAEDPDYAGVLIHGDLA